MRLAEIQSRLAQAGAPGRWMALFLADDIAQEIALADWMYATPTARNIAIQYAMRRLRHEIGSREITRVPNRPAALRPSKQLKRTGYRANHEAHRQARLKVAPEVRRDNARAGAIARYAS